MAEGRKGKESINGRGKEGRVEEYKWQSEETERGRVYINSRGKKGKRKLNVI